MAVLHHPIDRRDHLRDIGSSAAIRNLERHDPRARRDPHETGRLAPVVRATRRRVTPGDDAGHVRAVAERVEVAQVVLLGLEGQVGAVHELVRGVESLDRRDARVDHCDVDAPPVVAVRPEVGGPDDIGRRLQGAGIRCGIPPVDRRAQADAAIHGHRTHAARAAQRRHRGPGDLGREPVDEGDLTGDGASEASDGVLRAVTGPRELLDDHPDVRGGAGGVATRCCCGQRERDRGCGSDRSHAPLPSVPSSTSCRVH